MRTLREREKVSPGQHRAPKNLISFLAFPAVRPAVHRSDRRPPSQLRKYIGGHAVQGKVGYLEIRLSESVEVDLDRRRCGDGSSILLCARDAGRFDPFGRPL